MIKTFYHTKLRGYITADVVDLGLVSKLTATPPATGDEALQPDTLPGGQAWHVRRGPSAANRAVIEAARAQPDTINGLIDRTGVDRQCVGYVIRQGHLVKVGKAPGKGKNVWRSVWGASC